MSRTGILLFFGRYAENVIYIGIYCGLICFFICEWLVHKGRYVARNPDSVENISGNAHSEAKLVEDEGENEVSELNEQIEF